MGRAEFAIENWLATSRRGKLLQPEMQRGVSTTADELMAVCDELEHDLTKAKAHQSAFAAAVAHHLEV
jgi:hypothetical protein